MTLSIVVLGLVTLQRAAELALAERNTRRLLAEGAVENGAEHHPIIVGLHAAWLAGLWWWGRAVSPDLGWLALYAVIMALRLWTIASRGEYWTTRILTLAGEPPVDRGPYRFMRCPNYLLLSAEIAVLPLALHMTAYAVVFSALNASILWIRIRLEAQARAETQPLVGTGGRRQL